MKTGRIIAASVLLVGIGVGIGAFMALRGEKAPVTTIEDEKVDAVKTSDSAADTEESLVTLEKVVAVTPDETYQYGAFCRVNRVPSEENFFVTFGGSNRDVQQSGKTFSPFGGAEGGNGYSYKIYDADFSYTGETGVIHSGGGDAASVMADGYYYFLAGTPPNDWIIKKIDPSIWETVDSTVVDMETDTEILNDMMLAYANGNLIASGLYDASGAASGDQKKTDPTLGMATHNHLYDTDLAFVEEFVLDDVPHINGSYVVFANDEYHYVTSTSFFGDLIVMRYDEDWKFIDSKTIDEGAQWAQGALYDERTDRFYVAYLDLPLTKENRLARGESMNIALGIYDAEWNLIEKVNVSGYDESDKKTPGRPSVILEDGKLYVSYDVATTAGPGEEEHLDWQCTVSVLDVNAP